MANFAFFIHDRGDHYLALRVFLFKLRRDLRPLAHHRRRRCHLQIAAAGHRITFEQRVLQSPSGVGIFGIAFHRNVDGEDAFVLEHSEIFESAATAGSRDYGHLIRSLWGDGERW